MFPTTVWTTIRQAGNRNDGALQQFAQAYRPPLAEFIRLQGFSDTETDDLCQDVFVRLLHGEVLAKADPNKGRLRSLLLAVTRHVIQDRRRSLKNLPVAEEHLDPVWDPAERHQQFDRTWILHLAERALDRLQAAESPYHQVLRAHLAGVKQDRNRLWIARRKLIARIRAEVAMTCSSPAEFEEEVAYLSAFLRPPKKSQNP